MKKRAWDGPVHSEWNLDQTRFVNKSIPLVEERQIPRLQDVLSVLESSRGDGPRLQKEVQTLGLSYVQL